MANIFMKIRGFCKAVYNKAFNRKILQFVDKRIDFWASYKARHVLAIIDNNKRLDYMIEGMHKAAKVNKFTGWWKRLLNKNYTLSGKKNVLDIRELIKLAVKKIFKYNYLQGEKTLCYVICILIFEGITIIINPLKALMEDQKVTRINTTCIPCASIYANTIQSKSEQEKIFEEIALGFTKILFITPEKLCLNKEFQNFITNIYNKVKVYFVIDEAHCIIDYGLLKKNWPIVPIILLTAICTYKDIQDIHTLLEIPLENYFIVQKSSFECREELAYFGKTPTKADGSCKAM
ncbi:hypothetical protein C1645_838427 [Glomus cerebriforme]|uniref:DNA 3'-5' helicase n=1 Tax=Glomus cerebriforme TaxID=658196 RepID=A0A397S3N4_9GLOM|nr:hypothetical protein C1645_838427 [Glomus cerebriforme]